MFPEDEAALGDSGANTAASAASHKWPEGGSEGCALPPTPLLSWPGSKHLLLWALVPLSTKQPTASPPRTALSRDGRREPSRAVDYVWASG